MHPAVAQPHIQHPYYQPHPAMVAPPRKHSGFGIASFVLALLFGLFEFAAVLAAGLMSTAAPGGIDEESPVAVLLGLAVCGGTLPLLIGATLGFVGLLQSHRNRTFAIIGLAFNAVALLCIGGLMLIGLAAA
jgi:hypothetical protein